jgi:apolipoprotein N-acyltransferase
VPEFWPQSATQGEVRYVERNGGYPAEFTGGKRANPERQLAAFGVLFLAMLSVLLWIGHLAGQASTDIRTMVVWVVIATVVAVCYGALALALYINRMAARLLKTLARISSAI